ncbi:MAG: protein kinase, partial [Acidobacteria bacterium]|nr:protein kinase [Acidobacteriota bacterium]
MVIGSTISHYRIVEKLGEGGMGVVYKAEDTTLERAVALKFLADHLLNDDEAKERFLREAKAAAALHHPNIYPVYEIAEAEGKTFIAMAFLEGESLEDRITQGPLSIKDALDIARQAAEGLEAAHEKGIVHRDIKPANIMVDPKGRPTIMDFGLARLTEASRLTKVDTAMGTVAYMAPEQAQGMDVDSRSDIWALGCVLYEMVAGQRPFLGQYDQALLYEIVHEEVAPLTSIRAGVPMELEFIVGKCLAKDRDDRTSAAQEVSRDLRTLAEKLKSGHSTILRTGQMTGAVPATMTGAHTLNPATTLPPDAVVMPCNKQRAVYGLAALLAIALLGLAFVHFTQAPPEAPPTPLRRFSFAPEAYAQDTSVISPDGKSILYRATAGQGSLWLRSLSDESAREVAGTAGALNEGFWSPDSLSIGFGAGSELKRVSINGGDPITLCELQSQSSYPLQGGTWSPDGERIVFSSGLRLYEIPARGGQPEMLFDPGDSPRATSVYPHFLPADGGSQGLVYVAAVGSSDQMLAVMNLETGERRELAPGSRPVYSSDGYLIHGPMNDAGEGLRALPFSLDTLEATGQSFPIDETGRAASVALDGTLAYTDSPATGGARTLVWRDRSGELIEAIGQPQPHMEDPALSPDGQRVAVSSSESGNRDIWVHDLIRSTKTRLTFDDGDEGSLTWSPSGEEITYWIRGSKPSITSKAADGTGEAAAVVESEVQVFSSNWSRDGRFLVYQQTNAETGPDILYVEIEADGSASEPVTFLATSAAEQAPKLSPDVR